MANKAIFLDRDGTVLRHYDYLTEVSQVQLAEGAGTALRYLKDRGWLLVLVTNQSGVARGLLTEETLHQIHAEMKARLSRQNAWLDAIYYCPFHPEGTVEKYRRDSDLRKPRPGMLLQAAREMDIDLAASWMIGDDDRDILAGRNAGCRTILIEERGSGLVQRGESQPDFRAANLQEAANLVIHHSKTTSQPPAVPQAPGAASPEPPQIPAVPKNDTTTPLAADKPNYDEPSASDTPTPAGATRPKLVSRAARRAAAESATQPPAADNPQSADDLLTRILHELRHQRHIQHSQEEFSVFRLIGMIIQMVVVLCLVMAYRAGNSAEPQAQAAQNYLLTGLVFQMMALTFMAGFK